ncbi:hypothetical protein SCHPADRAFT_472302 [Schizopora paradoxa]|uniref:Uncharacterized protein n=1 Tax=Schizopora paradoxa TaxID=27342 RepID=A0A0H2RPQ9_9AGAM|nr:hypothetical protein SCHPADRAFT_472302 [Schizopora paradoxa]
MDMVTLGDGRPRSGTLKREQGVEQVVPQSTNTNDGVDHNEVPKSSDGAMQEVDSFLNTIGVAPSDLFANVIAQDIVNSPSEMHDSDHHMDVEDDLQRRRESQIWEGTFDNSPRKSRKRKRTEHQEGNSASGRSTESPSTDFSQSNSDIVPGTLAYDFGLANPGILTLTFDIDEEQAAAAARWNLISDANEFSEAQQQINVNLECIERRKLSVIRENLNPVASPTTNVDLDDQSITLGSGSDWSMLEEYSVWVECDDCSWTPIDLASQHSALNITGCIKSGKNEVKIISLADISGFAFAVYTSVPSEDLRRKHQAKKQTETIWDKLRDMARGVGAKL